LIYLTDHPVITGFELESADAARSSRLQAAADRLKKPPGRPHELYRVRLRIAKRPAHDFPVVEMLHLPGDGRAALHQPERPAVWIDCPDPVRGVRR
jgi:hypothetical protein